MIISCKSDLNISYFFWSYSPNVALILANYLIILLFSSTSLFILSILAKSSWYFYVSNLCSYSKVFSLAKVWLKRVSIFASSIASFSFISSLIFSTDPFLCCSFFGCAYDETSILKTPTSFLLASSRLI